MCFGSFSLSHARSLGADSSASASLVSPPPAPPAGPPSVPLEVIGSTTDTGDAENKEAGIHVDPPTDFQDPTFEDPGTTHGTPDESTDIDGGYGAHGELVCTDIDFEGAELTVSNLGGSEYCCNVCPHNAQQLCCPTKGERDTDVILEVPYDFAEMKEFLSANLCTPNVTPDRDGDTSYMKIGPIQTTTDAPPINIILKNVTEYIPTWPRLGVAPECIDRNNCGQLAQKGFLNNGRKSGGVVAQDIVQLNMCSERFVKFNGCFVDDSNAPIVLQSSAVRFFDIDHGADKDMGPEVFQFKCPGGTFSLYGYEHDEEGETEFLVHMNTEAKALERAASGETTVNGLPVHVYDCPEHDWVTLWSSRSGKGKDNPISSIILEDPINGATQERSMVQVNFTNAACFEVIFANMPVGYHGTPDVPGLGHLPNAKEQLLLDSTEINLENYPDLGSGECGYDVSGRNWLFAGLKGFADKDCTPPPAPPPPPPPLPYPGVPTKAPTTAAPTASPTVAPTAAPTVAPTAAPTAEIGRAHV